jgi:hypothetical protein
MKGELMGLLKKRVLQPALAMLFTVGLVAAAVVPAQAASKWKDWPRGCGTFFTLICDVQYTGGWPSGKVRSIGSANMYEVGLEVSGDSGASWHVVATTSGTTTPSVSAGKFSEYRGCVKTASGGSWLCLAPQGPIYLGD